MKDEILNLMNRDLEENGLENDWEYSNSSYTNSVECLPSIQLAKR